MSGTEATSDKLPIMGLVAMGLAVLVIANDFTALSVALPAMESDFAADVTTVQWVINGYALVFGVLIVTGGRLADMFGRRDDLLRSARRSSRSSRSSAASRRTSGLAGLPGADGRRRRDDVAGDPRHDLRDPAGQAAGSRRRLDPRRRRVRQRHRAAASAACSPTRSAGAGSSSSTCRSRPSRCSSPGAWCHATSRRSGDRLSTMPASPRSRSASWRCSLALDEGSDRGWRDPVILGLFIFAAGGAHRLRLHRAKQPAARR